MKKKTMLLAVLATAFAPMTMADTVTGYSSSSVPNISTSTTYQPPIGKAVPAPAPAPLPVAAPTPAPSVVTLPAPVPSPAVVTLPSPDPSQSQAPSINPASQQGNQSQNSGSAMNAAIGAALMAAGMATVPPNVGLLIMGAAALAQGMMDSGAAGQSANTGVASNLGGGGSGGGSGGGGGGGVIESPSPTPTPSPLATPAPTGTGGYTNPAVQAGYQALGQAGYQVTPNGIVNPDGSVTPLSALGSAGGMSAAGLDGSAYGEAQKVIAATTGAGGSVASGVGVAEGAGGGGGGAATGGKTSEGLQLPSLPNPFALPKEAKGQLVAGKTVLFDGEPIGVRAENIFDMVHNAYQKKRQRNAFIESDSGVVPGASLRMPASVPPQPRIPPRTK